MKKDNHDTIYLMPEKKKRTLDGIPNRLYFYGWLTILIAIVALVAVWLLLRRLTA
ncbi:MAG: hypothetical protein K2I19_08445 [Muribaculaceae bacterium]|nr:hypothetical protein [Muribaculaceae bacterium]